VKVKDVKMEATVEQVESLKGEDVEEHSTWDQIQSCENGG
jgi:hypothetical protein